MYQMRPWRDLFSIKVMIIFCVWLLWTRNWALFSNARYLTDCHMYISVCCFSLIWNFFKVVIHCEFFPPYFSLCISVSKKNQTNINFLKKSKPRKAFNHNIIYFTFIESWIAVFITNTFIYQSIQCNCFSPTLLISVFTIFGGFRSVFTWVTGHMCWIMWTRLRTLQNWLR